MSFDWTDFLTLAEILQGSLTTATPAVDEAALRSVVSRAYYSVFGLARRRVRIGEGVAFPPTGAVHAAVARHYGRADESDRKRIAEDLLWLRDRRNQCDYDDDVSDLPSVAEEALNLAHEVINLLARL